VGLGGDRGVGFGEQSVVAVLEALKRGEMVIVSDDEARENEGDLIMAAEYATAESIAFMVRHTSGVLCVGMESERIDALRLPQMVGANEDPKGTAFTVSVDARVGTTTGISAADRALTMRRLADGAATGDDFQRPGHIFPLRARKHGALARQGHTEAAVDLCRLAGLAPVGVLSEMVSADGQQMAKMPELLAFQKEHNLAMTTITDLVAYRLRHDTLVEPIGPPARMPTKFGLFEAHAFRSFTDGFEHIALCKGGPWETTDGEPLLVRVHSECCTGDIFGSLRCDCGTQLEAALQQIEAEGARSRRGRCRPAQPPRPPSPRARHARARRPFGACAGRSLTRPRLVPDSSRASTPASIVRAQAEACCSTCGGRRGAGSGWATRSAPMRCRTRGATLYRCTRARRAQTERACGLAEQRRHGCALRFQMSRARRIRALPNPLALTTRARPGRLLPPLFPRRPTSTSACPSTRVSMAWVRRSCACSASPRCG
jgi:3,4-dihydroxy 2-butanone 4-phosphate synthase/GTP cyclohydrolase II